MPAIVEGRASDLSIPAARRSPAVPALLGGSGVLLVAAVLLGDATDEARLAWIGAGAVVVVAVAALVLPRPRVGRAGVALFALVAAATAWAAISVLWSIQPDRSWDVVNRGLAYMALLGLGALVAAATPRAARLTAGAFAVVFGAAIVWALAGKAVPALGSDLERVARLQSPLGYWNALALLIAMSLPLWLWVAAPPSRSRVLRAAGCAAIALAVAALALTASRGGILVAVVAVGAWLALVGQRVESGLVLVAGGVPGAAAAGWPLALPLLSALAFRPSPGRAGGSWASCSRSSPLPWRSRRLPRSRCTWAGRASSSSSFAIRASRPTPRGGSSVSARAAVGPGGRRPRASGATIRCAGPARGRSSSRASRSAPGRRRRRSRTTCPCRRSARRVSSGWCCCWRSSPRRRASCATLGAGCAARTRLPPRR